MSQREASEALDAFGGIAITKDIDTFLKKRGVRRSALNALNSMRLKGDVEMIESCLNVVGGRAKIWIKYP